MGSIKNKAFILHGWTYSTEKWQPFINLLKQKSIEAIILKIPGLTEKIDKVWKIDDYVEWLRQTVDVYSSSERNESRSISSRQARTITLNNNKAILIGHSNGGRIALNFAIKYPDKLNRLILIDSSGIYHNELSLKIKRLVFGNIAKVGKKLTSSEKFKSLLYKIAGESDYKNANHIMKQTMLNLVNSDMFLNLDRVTIPTLIIWGREDKTTPLSDGKLMNKLIKNSKLNIVEDAKHSPQFSHLEKVTETILENLKISNTLSS